MKKSRRLEPIVRVAENWEHQAAQQLGAAQQDLASAEQRLGELRHYREEYIRRFQAAGASGMGAGKMRDYQQFLASLNLAIDQQLRLVAIQAGKVEEKRRHWFASHQKTQVLDNVVTRYQSEEQRLENRREQKEQDERAQRGQRQPV